MRSMHGFINAVIFCFCFQVELLELFSFFMNMAVFTVAIMMTMIEWLTSCGFNDTNCITSDILSFDVLPNIHANTLIDVALSINRKWRIAAIRVLSSRTRFLSMKQMKFSLLSVAPMHWHDLSSEQAIIKSCLGRRSAAVCYYDKHPQASSLRLLSKSDFYLFELGEQIKTSQYCLISIEALITEQNENKTSVKSARLAINEDPIIQINGDRQYCLVQGTESIISNAWN